MFDDKLVAVLMYRFEYEERIFRSLTLLSTFTLILSQNSNLASTVPLMLLMLPRENFTTTRPPLTASIHASPNSTFTSLTLLRLPVVRLPNLLTSVTGPLKSGTDIGPNWLVA